MEEPLKEDELISLPAGTSEQIVPSNSVVDQAKQSPQRCVAENTTTVEEIGRCAVSRKKLDESMKETWLWLCCLTKNVKRNAFAWLSKLILEIMLK